MPMSRKHYVALADALATSADLAEAQTNIANVLAADNPAFNRGRFYVYIARTRRANHLDTIEPHTTDA